MTHSDLNEAQLWRVTWIGLAGALALLLAIAPDYGVTWDAPIRMAHGEMIVDYYASGFTDETALNPEPYSEVLRYYSAGFDSFNELLHRLLGTDIFMQRHIVNALCAWVMLLFTVRAARFSFGPVAGLLALALLLCWPRFIGHAINNPKDIPFGATFIMASFFLLRYAMHGSLRFTKDVLWFTLSAALCVLVRPGGLILMGYLGAVLGVQLLERVRRREGPLLKDLRMGASVFVLTLASVLLLSSLFWPWALQSPLTRPIEALLVMGDFPQAVPTLFQGQWFPATEAPWSYLPTWFAITMPVGLLAGLLLGLYYTCKERQKPALYCLGFGLFPPVYAMATGATLYDGVRHMLFIYPFIAILGAFGMWRLSKDIARPRLRTLAYMALLGLGLGPAALFSVFNHPNQVVFFNVLVGGVQNAEGRYDLDYWGNCYKQSVDWLNAEAAAENATYSVMTLSMFPPARPLIERAPHLEFVPSDADYGIYLVRYGLGHSGKPVHAVMADLTPLCLAIRDPQPVAQPAAAK